MRKLLLLALTTAGILTLSSTAQAQFGGAGAGYGKYSRPSYGVGYRNNISPYLNLARTNNNTTGLNAGINYYLGTRSEQQRRTNAQQFSEEIRALEIDQTNIITSGTTPQRNALPRYFNNTGGFFPGR